MPGFSLLLPGRRGSGPDDDRRDCQLRGGFRDFPLQFSTRGLSHEELTILVVEQSDTEGVSAVQRKFGPMFFPDTMVQEVGSEGVFQLPDRRSPDPHNKDRSDLCSVIRLRGLDGQLAKYENGLGMVEGGEKEIESDAKSDTTVGTWICENADLGANLRTSRLVVLVFRGGRSHVREFAPRLQDYFNRKPYMLNAIIRNELFIYIALYECFNSFTTLLHMFEGLFNQATIIQDQNIMGIFGRSYLLNKGLIMMSYCHADVLAHKSTLKRLEQLNETIGNSDDWEDNFVDFLSDMKDEVDEFEAHLGYISERFKTALDLEFSLSGERLNHIMMWFTGFTVLFTPIAFVAAVFSIVDSNPIWFLISSSAVLVISIAICLWAYSSIINTGKGVNGRYLRKQLHKLPYQENRFRGGSKQPGNDLPDKNPPLPRGHSGARHRREHVVIDDPETAFESHGIRIERPSRRPGDFDRVSSSSSSAPSIQAHERTHKAPAQRQRTQSSTMYTRRRTPQSSSVQNQYPSHSYGPRPPPHAGPGDHFGSYARRPGREIPTYAGPRRQQRSRPTFWNEEVHIDPRTREAELRRTVDASIREEELQRDQERQRRRRAEE